MTYCGIKILKTPLLARRGGMNEAVLKAQTNECRGGGVRFLSHY